MELSQRSLLLVYGSRIVERPRNDIGRSSGPRAMRISYLADQPALAAPLIPGLLEQWRHVLPEQTAETRAAKFRAHMNRDNLPIAWVAHEGSSVFGTAALRAVDVEGREDLTPWLAGVYVLPQFRRRGIASALCEVVEAKARALRMTDLHDTGAPCAQD